MPGAFNPSPYTGSINVLKLHYARERKTGFGCVLISEWYKNFKRREFLWKTICEFLFSCSITQIILIYYMQGIVSLSSTGQIVNPFSKFCTNQCSIYMHCSDSSGFSSIRSGYPSWVLNEDYVIFYSQQIIFCNFLIIFLQSFLHNFIPFKRAYGWIKNNTIVIFKKSCNLFWTIWTIKKWTKYWLTITWPI